MPGALDAANGDAAAEAHAPERARLHLAGGHDLDRGAARTDVGEGGALVVRFTDPSSSCSGTAKDPQATLSIALPPGPGARFFSGVTIGVRAWGAVDGRNLQYGPSDVVVELEPFTPAKGGTIRGRLDTPLGAGTFQAEICGFDPVPSMLPDDAPDAPASGTLDGHPFTVKKGLAYLAGGTGGDARLEDLRLFSDETATCRELTSRGVGLYVHFLAGAGARRPLTGTRQPSTASVTNVPIERGAVTGNVPTWIRFDRLVFEPGARIAGSIAVADATIREHGVATRVAGRFEAEVCPRRGD